MGRPFFIAYNHKPCNHSFCWPFDAWLLPLPSCPSNQDCPSRGTLDRVYRFSGSTKKICASSSSPSNMLCLTTMVNVDRLWKCLKNVSTFMGSADFSVLILKLESSVTPKISKDVKKCLESTRFQTPKSNHSWLCCFRSSKIATSSTWHGLLRFT